MLLVSCSLALREVCHVFSTRAQQNSNRRTKGEVLLQLPSKQRQAILLDVSQLSTTAVFSDALNTVDKLAMAGELYLNRQLLYTESITCFTSTYDTNENVGPEAVANYDGDGNNTQIMQQFMETGKKKLKSVCLFVKEKLHSNDGKYLTQFQPFCYRAVGIVLFKF